MFGLNVALEGDLQCGLIITLSAGIYHSLVPVLFMLGQTSLECGLEVTLITRIPDSFMNSPDMDLEVVGPFSLKITEAAGIRSSTVDRVVMSSHLVFIEEHFLTVLVVTANRWFSFCFWLIFTHFNFRFLLFSLHYLVV